MFFRKSSLKTKEFFKFNQYSYFLIITVLFLILARYLFFTLYKNINPFEFDTSYFINIVLGTMKDNIPNINTLNTNSIWECSDKILKNCINSQNNKIITQNDLLPIEYTSGYFMVFATSFISKIFSFFNNSESFNTAKNTTLTIIKSYSYYCILVYFICTLFISKSLNILFKNKLIYRFEKSILTLAFLFIPFSCIPVLTNTIIGEFTGIIYLSAAFIIFCASSISYFRYQENSLFKLKFEKNKYNFQLSKISLFTFICTLLASESKSSLLPTCLAIFFSQIILLLVNSLSNEDYFSLKKLKKYFSNVKSFMNILIGFISFLMILISSKLLPILIYISLKNELFIEYLKKSRDFASFQANAGRGWGGIDLNQIENIKNLLGNFIYSRDMTFLSLMISLFLITFLFLILIIFVRKSSKRHFFLSKIIILNCNVVILLSAWLFPLIFKFPYPRTISVSVSMTLLIPISLALFTISSKDHILKQN